MEKKQKINKIKIQHFNKILHIMKYQKLYLLTLMVIKVNLIFNLQKI